MKLGLLLLAGAALRCAGQEAKPAAAGGAAVPGEEKAPEAGSREDPAQQRLQLNLLGQMDAESGESRRNENVQFNLIDRNAMRELNVRLGVTATAVQEFQPERSYYGAEYGRPATNAPHARPAHLQSLHGALWEGHSNHLLRARSFFQAGDVRPATENDYGVRVGGLRLGGARMSVEGSQQKLRGFVNGNVLVPKPDERTPLATDPFLYDLVSGWLKAYPEEAPNRTDIDPRALNTNAAQRINTNSAGGRVDIPRGARDWFALRYQFTSQQVDAFQLVAGQNPNTDTHSHSAGATWTRSLTAATVGLFTAGFERVSTLIRPDELAVGPTVSAANVIQGLGPAPPIPIVRAQNRFRYAAGVEQTRGRHRWVAGAELLRTQVNGREQDGERGIITFGNDFGRDALTNFRMGTPSTFTKSLGNTHRGYRAWNVFLHAGDVWQVGQNLTVQAGVRYEPMSRPVEVNGRDVIPFPCDCNNVAPRAGLAYRLPGNWGVVRAAYGVQFGEIFATTYGQVRMSPPGSYRVIVGAPDLSNPLGGLTTSDIKPGFRTGIFDVSADMVTPYGHQYNATWERGLPWRSRVQIAYIGSRTHKLFQMWFDNRARVVEGIPQTSATINQRRPNPDYLEILRLLNGSRAYFDAARVNLVVGQGRAVTAEVSYWFSKSLDLGNDYTSTLAGVDARQGRSQSEFRVHEDLKGRSQFDQPHALLARGTWTAPEMPNSPAWLQAVAARWVLSGVVLLKNGTSFSVESGSDGPGFGNVDGQGSDRVNVVNPAVLGRTVGNPDDSARLLPRAAFRFIGPTDDRGNLGRNTFRRGRIANVNAAAERVWRLPGEWALEFRAESINFLNTPQFAEPNYNLASPSFGAITNTMNDGRVFRLTLRAQF